VVFVALGGATEASIHSTFTVVGRVDPDWTSIPYGRPMANQQALILDPFGQPVPVGVVGELHLGGLGLSRGYLRRPALTASRFVPHPAAGRYPTIPAGARLYRTGDLARYHGDGTIELVGRADHQVKLRGFRVELGEVSAALLRHPGVAQTVVVSEPDRAGDNRLIGFYVPASGASVDPAELRGFLRSALPDYMVPARLVELDRLPLSPNGKVDRRQLPAVGEFFDPPKAAYAEPVGPVETVLSQLWAAVLDGGRVGRYDDVFDLGGHSLHATRIAALARDALGVEVPLRLLFEAPTVAGQASALVELGRQDGVDIEAGARVMLRVKDLSDDEVRHLLDESQGR
jgi:hypothetical protein